MLRIPLRSLVPLSLLASCVLGGCARTSSDRAASGDSTAVSTGATAADTTFRRGLARLAGQELRFAACDGPPEAPIADHSGGALTSAVKSLAGDGGSTVYVEFTGSDAGGGLVAFEFLRAAPVGEGGGCNRPVGTYLYRAFGNEPFWSVTVWEDSVVFGQPDAPSHIAWPSTEVRATRDPAGTRIWTAQDAGGLPVLTLTIERATCTDGMSGEVTAFRARATLSGRDLRGCARAGAAADEAH